MKRFKLVRKYPGVLINEGEFITDKAGAYFPENGGNGINPKHVENYPEFWEEVKDEFPKIISFRNKCNNVTFNLCENGKYSSTNSSGYFPKEHLLKESHDEIYQVAVSETEVFTLGDRVKYSGEKCNYDNFIIDHFYYNNNNGIILARSKNCEIVEHVTEIKKAPGVLFVTEDGIEIFKGDKFYYISIREPNPACYSGCAQEGSAINTNYKYFSTVEAAKKYIDENKPIYSKKQVEEALEESYFRESYILDVPYCCADKFRENIFKQKLGL